jgi:hypothetical protein
VTRFLVAALLFGCSAQPRLQAADPGLAGLALAEVHPAIWLPSTEVDVVGAGFVDPSRGSARLHLTGNGIDLQLPLGYVDAQHLSATLTPDLFGQFPVNKLSLEATLIFDSAIDRQPHAADPIEVAVEVESSLAPSLAHAGGGTLHVNDLVPLDGDGFLLGTAEGSTHALLSGCFVPAGAQLDAGCTQGTTATDVDVAAQPAMPWDRQHALFPFAPSIAGIHPGAFQGTVRLENRPASGAAAQSETQAIAATLVKPELAAAPLSPTAASLGQYVEIAGAGFVGAAADEVTLLHVVGSFRADGATTDAPVDLKLVPGFVSGTHARYVMDETDALGKAVDLRRISGSFSGTVAPIIRKGTDEETGDAVAATLAIAPVKQVVWVKFEPSYVDSLRLYGLAAADDLVRQRILAVAARDYAGVNIEFRTDEPTDFASYSEVDVEGPDPNGLDLLGYDNTPGKDVGNQRLFDRIGGVNATTQSDGFPGYGGIFSEQFLGFSSHPSAQVSKLPVDAPLFDQIFDPLRPDTGTPAVSVELAGLALPSNGQPCPADSRDRASTIACGVFVLGNLVGTTLTHEVGHSLGLADPNGDLFHDPGDAPNRLMDAGDARPFEERAELVGQGPGAFCGDEYLYLRAVLPGQPSHDVPRAACQ